VPAAAPAPMYPIWRREERGGRVRRDRERECV
jgi:hypothetical protein